MTNAATADLEHYPLDDTGAPSPVTVIVIITEDDIDRTIYDHLTDAEATAILASAGWTVDAWRTATAAEWAGVDDEQVDALRVATIRLRPNTSPAVAEALDALDAHHQR